MVFEPVGRKRGDALQRSRLLKQMSCTRYDGEARLAVQLRQRRPIERENFAVVTADDQEGRGPHSAKRRPREIRSTTAGDDGSNLWYVCSSCHSQGMH